MSTSKKYAFVLLLLLIGYVYMTYPSLFTSLSHLKFPTFHISTGSLMGNALANTVNDVSIVGTPDMSTNAINAVLKSVNSPARGTGQALYNGSLASGVKVSFALAIFKHESGYGTAGVARATHSLGNIRCSNGYACINGYRAYTSWVASYTDFYTLIKNLYITQKHLTTVGQVLHTYAPTSENSTSDYIADVLASMNTWKDR